MLTVFRLETAATSLCCVVCLQVGDCGYQSVLRNVMKHHQTKHSDERPYMCELCGSKFKSKVTLRTHIFMHTNQRRFKCTYCSNAYIQKVGLIVSIEYIYIIYINFELDFVSTTILFPSSTILANVSILF